jgi:hypothetical protein
MVLRSGLWLSLLLYFHNCWSFCSRSGYSLLRCEIGEFGVESVRSQKLACQISIDPFHAWSGDWKVWCFVCDGFFFSFLIFATISMMFMSKRECIRALYSEFFLCLFFAHLILFYFIFLTWCCQCNCYFNW